MKTRIVRHKTHTGRIVYFLPDLVFALAVMLALPSCTNIPAGVFQPGTAGYVTQVGGKLELATASATAKVDNQESFKRATKVLDNGMLAWAVTNIAKSFDANATSVDKANIEASSKAASEKTALEATKEANRSAEAMAAMEMEVRRRSANLPRRQGAAGCHCVDYKRRCHPWNMGVDSMAWQRRGRPARVACVNWAVRWQAIRHHSRAYNRGGQGGGQR